MSEDEKALVDGMTAYIASLANQAATRAILDHIMNGTPLDAAREAQEEAFMQSLGYKQNEPAKHEA